jgi:N-acetylmuramic acid 6-phosphate etherase
MMVDLQMNSKKLEERSKRTVMIITGVDYQDAQNLLLQANGHVKTAVVMYLADVDREFAEKALKESEGFVRQAIKYITQVNR